MGIWGLPVRYPPNWRATNEAPSWEGELQTEAEASFVRLGDVPLRLGLTASGSREPAWEKAGAYSLF